MPKKKLLGEQRKKERHRTEKFWVLAAFAIIFLILLYALFVSIRSASIGLIIVLAIAIIILVPIAIFAIDIIWQAGE